MNQDLYRLSATEVLDLISADKISVTQYAQSLIGRVKARDSTVHGWAFWDDQLVLEQARALDQIPKEKRGPLHGIAIGVKDVILTKDMPTQYNSPIYKDDAPAIDAACVRILRQAGALIFGKTHTTEFAAVTTAGPAANPHDPERTPGGSSSGSGAVVGDFQVPISLGTQTGGSTIRPGSYNGIVAMKPTWNAISREGLKMYSITCDTLGLYARSVQDLELLAKIFHLKSDEPVPAQPFSVKGSKFGFVKGPTWQHAGQGTKDAMNLASRLLQEAGANVEEVDLPADFDKLPDWHAKILDGEGRVAFLGEYAHKDQLDPFIVDHIEKPISKLSQKEQLQSYDGCARLRPEIDSIAGRYAALITPSTVDEAPLGLKSTGNALFNLIWTVLHVPVINVPGFKGASDMPIGLSLVGARYQDTQLLHVAKGVAEVFAKGGWESKL